MTYTNIRSQDRVITLAPMPNKNALSSTGLVDNRLFTGGQSLRLKMDPQTCLWYFQYTNNGILPEGLSGKFTGFKAGLKHAEDYFRRRNIQITRVED
jgi:hypothetical protein